MNCPKCGQEVPDRAPFCGTCGAAIPAGSGEGSASAAPSCGAADPAATSACGAADPTPTATTPASATPACGAADPSPTNGAGACGAADPSPYSSAAPACGTSDPAASPYAGAQYAQQEPPIYTQGCVSAAWNDIHNSDGWMKRVGLLSLVNLVPILNWFVEGYAMRWARQLPLGSVSQMPKSIFIDRNFINGFFYFVIALVCSCVGAVLDTLFGNVGFIGALCIIVLTLALLVLQNVMIIRSAVADSLGAGFDLSAVWAAMKKRPGQVLFVAIVPALVIGLIASLVCLVLIAVGCVVLGSDIVSVLEIFQYYDYYGTLSTAAELSLINQILAIALSLLPIFIVCWLLCSFADVLAKLLIMRSLGHWAARNVPEWLQDPKVTATAFTHPQL